MLEGHIKRLADVLEGIARRAATSSMTISDLIERMTKGGWLGDHSLPLEDVCGT